MKDPRDLMAGYEIHTLQDLYIFLDDINNNSDRYIDEREKLINKLYKYHDGCSCERVVKLLKL